MTYRKHTQSAWKLVLALAALAVLSGPTVVRACSTPVYAYAMNNWAPTPFGIFYFYRDKQADEDKKVNLKLVELDAERPASTNMIFQAVDVAKKEELDRVSEMVIKVWRSHDDGKTPIHLVLAPWGAELFAGRLDPATLEAMINSPARTRVAELLGEGNAAVLLLLAAPDTKANKKAEEVIGQVTAKAAAGGIYGLADQDAAAALAFLPGDSSKKGPDDEPDPAEARPTLKLATLTIKRDNPAEKWFVRLLTLIESDLHEYAKEPMVFTVFGRGRALEPYLGKGITPENLVDCMSFLGGACSCMVKDQNPGADILMQCDWDAVAEAMPMNEDPADDGRMAYREFTPGEPVADVSSGQKGSPGQEELAMENGPAKDGAKAEPAAKVSTPSEPGSPTTTSQPNAAAAGGLTKPAGSFASRQIWAYGLGLVVAALLVLGAGFVILRRH